MKVPKLQRWSFTPSEAIALQKQLAQQIVTDDRLGPVKRVAGVDVGFEDKGKTTRAAVVVMSLPDLCELDAVLVRSDTCFPYIPGLLSFREIPALLKAFAKLHTTPDLLLCDGQGIAHPRRLGIASHLGLLLDLPSIGVAKSRLCGTDCQPGFNKGQWCALIDKQHTIGAVLRSRTGVRPLYVSPGHRIGLKTALEYVLRCTPQYRLPEPIRRADKLASCKKS